LPSRPSSTRRATACPDLAARGDRVVKCERRRDTEEADATKENLTETLGEKRGVDARIGALIAQHLDR
jgi:hypothetical protein